MGLCRVWFMTDRKIQVSYPDARIKFKPPHLTLIEWANEQFDELPKRAPQFQGLDYTDMDTSELPQNKADRDRWRGDKGTGIKIDKNVVLRQDLWSALDKELGKPEPDTINVLRIQRKLNKQEHD